MSVEIQHHEYSASGFEGPLNCAGMKVLTKGIKDTYSANADDGSASHFLGAEALINNTSVLSYLGRYIICWEKPGERDGQCFSDQPLPDGAVQRSKWEVTPERVEHVTEYVRRIREKAKDHILLVEQRVEFGPAIGLPGAFGTSDTIIIASDSSWIYIGDLKYGYSHVYATNNTQMQLYALGVINDYKDILIDLDKLKEIRMEILQPRIHNFSDWTTTLPELIAFAKTAQAAIERSEEAKRMWEIVSKQSPEAIDGWYATYLKASDKGCKWCKAKSDCPEMAKQSYYEVANIAEASANGLEDLDAEESIRTLQVQESLSPADKIEQSLRRIPHLSMAEVEKFYQAIPMMETWCEAIAARMRTEMLQGYKSSNYKLVKGRDGNRKWIDTEDVEQTLKKFKLKVDEIYDKKLKSPTSISTFLKDSPKQLKTIESKITRSEGTITVAPKDDKRESLDPYGEALSALPEYEEEPTAKGILRDFMPQIEAYRDKKLGIVKKEVVIDEIDISDLC